MSLTDQSELLAALGANQDLDIDDELVNEFRSDESMDIPIGFTDMDIWSNYTNDYLYVMDVKMREFLKKTRYARESKGGYKTTASVVFAWMYGRKAEPRDGAKIKVIHELLKYYCTSYTGSTTFGGKRVNRVYKFSRFACTSKRPYSLRLRIEENTRGTNPLFSTPGSKKAIREQRRQENRASSEQEAE